ncbi:MAG: nitroreductase family protein, partial [Candidatus Omnitrophica bacterium]|nr:nitroreductase family protein [Candidatus Omnitrophota bacterium]
SLTEYSSIIKKANVVILVFLDKRNSYNLVKDAQAVGACIQNMLLCAAELGISSCWMGEILNQKAKVNKLLNIKSRYELMAAVALGYSDKKSKSRRIGLDKLILKEYL